MTLALGDYTNPAFGALTKGHKSCFLKASMPHHHILSQDIVGWFLVHNLSFPQIRNLNFYLETVLHSPEIDQVLNNFRGGT